MPTRAKSEKPLAVVRHHPRPEPDTLTEDVMSVCEELHRRARDNGWTIEELARRADGNFRTFNEWKHGRQQPKIHLLQAFARALSCNVRLTVQDASGVGTNDSTGGTVVSKSLVDQISAIAASLPEEQRQNLLNVAVNLLALHRP